MSTNPDKISAPHKRNFKRGCLLAASAVAVVVLTSLGFAYFQLKDLIDSQASLEKNLAAAAAAGIQTDVADRRQPNALAPDQNAALDLARAATLAGETASVLSQGRIQAFIDGSDVDADQVIAAFEPALDQFSLAATKIGCQFPRDWANPAAFDFRPIQGIKLPLAVLARRAQVHFRRGKVEQGAADLELLRQMVDVSTAEPLMPVALMRAEYTAIWVSACMQSLSAMPSVAPRIKGYLNNPVTFDVRTTVQNQASFMLQNAAKVGDDKVAADRLGGLPTDQKVVQEALYSEAAVAAKQAVAVVDDAGNDLTNLIYRAIKFEASWSKSKSKSAALARQTLPNILGLSMTLGNLEDRRLLALEACEVVLAGTPQRYAPKTLDTFGQKPLVYKKIRDGFVLYALGKDGVDNGGNASATQVGADHVLTYTKRGTTLIGG